MTKPAPRFPAITASLSALALALWLIPGAAEALQFERTAVAAGEFWRLVTDHLTHWTTSHVGWDLAAFALLGTLVERRSRRLLVATLAASALAISAGVWLIQPDLAIYRGLSGIDSALFAALLWIHVVDATNRRRWLGAAWPALAAAAFVAKMAIELLTATTVFVAADATFVPVPLAHLIGGGTGLLIALRYSRSAKAAHVVAA